MHVCIALYSMMHTYFFSHSAYRVKHFHLGTEFKWKKILQGSKNDNWGLGMKENNSDQMLKRKYHKVDQMLQNWKWNQHMHIYFITVTDLWQIRQAKNSIFNKVQHFSAFSSEI